MKTVPLTIYVPEDLLPLAKIRAAEENYRSPSEYGAMLIFYDCVTRRPHILTQRVSDMAGPERDATLAAVAADFDRKERKAGGWIQHRIRELATELAKEMIATGQIPGEKLPENGTSDHANGDR